MQATVKHGSIAVPRITPVQTIGHVILNGLRVHNVRQAQSAEQIFVQRGQSARHLRRYT